MPYLHLWRMCERQCRLRLTSQREIGTLAPAAVEVMRDAGLFTLKLPEVLGGAEADPVTQIEVIEALSYIDASAGWCLMIGATAIGQPGAFTGDERSLRFSAEHAFPQGLPQPR